MVEKKPLRINLTSSLVNTYVKIGVGLTLLLVIADALVLTFKPHPTITSFFNMAREDSASNWYSVAAWMSAAVFSALLYFLITLDGASLWARARIGIISATLLFFAFDDGAQIHERIDYMLEPIDATWFVNDWALAMSPFLLLFVVSVFVFATKDLRATKARMFFFLGLAAFAIGVGLDFFEGMYDGPELELIDIEWESSLGHWLRSIEESIETIGTVLLGAGILYDVVERFPNWQVFPEVQNELG